MKAFLLAAGNGSRLRPLTDDCPKCFLPIQGVPLLAVWLENCRRAGVDEVLINTHAHAAKVREFVKGYDGALRIRLTEESELLGSAGTLAANRGFVEDEDGFLILYADVLTNLPLAKMVEFHRERTTAATLGVYRVPDPRGCGVVTFDHSQVVQSFVEKPANPQSNWAFSGIMIGTRPVLDLLPSRRPADIGFDLLPQFVGRMSAYPIRDYLLDIGTPENYQLAQSSWTGLERELKAENACCRA